MRFSIEINISIYKNIILFFLSFIFSFFLQATTSYDISTIAGTGAAGFNGDGTAATSATLNGPKGLWMDSTYIYFVDAGTQHVRKFPIAGGNISTIAGTGTASFSGDGGVATAATFNSPFGIGGDTAGNVFVADATNGRIRAITSNGNIASIAGTNSGTASSAQSYSGYSGDGGAATSALLNTPSSITRDSSGNIYFADTVNNRIRMLVGTTGTYFGSARTANCIYTIAGTGTAGFSGDGGAATSALLNAPTGISVDSSNNVYIADAGNNCIRMLINTAGPYFGSTRTANCIYTIAGTGSAGSSGDGGAAISALLNAPTGVSVDSSNNVYIADTNNNRIRMLIRVAGTYFGSSRTANFIYTIAGTGTAGFSDGTATTVAMLNSPKSIFVNGSTVYVADYGNHLIRSLSGTVVTTIAGTTNNITSGNSGDGGLAAYALMSNPNGICKDSSNNIYFADTANNCIRMFTVGGNISTLSGFTDAFTLSGPKGICLDSNNNLYVANTNGNNIFKRTSTGTVSNVSAFSSLAAPQGVFVDSFNNIYVANTNANSILMYWGAATSGSGAGQYTQGNVYTIASPSSTRNPSADAVVSSPLGLWVVGSATPANIRVYFSDGNFLRFFKPASTSNSLGTVYSPTNNNVFGIFGAADTSSGIDTIYYSSDTNVIKKITITYASPTSGTVTSLAGTGTAGLVVMVALQLLLN